MTDNFEPYVGFRPFEGRDRKVFFGRRREASDLVSLIIAHPDVLLYAQSGAGKTSLINAGVIPSLEQEGLEVLPVARVQGLIPTEILPEAIDNIYAFNCQMSWSGEKERFMDPSQITRMSLKEFLLQRPRLLDADGTPCPRVAIFDQFEELFTAYPERWSDRNGFFSQVNALLASDPSLRVLFAMREDYIAQLDPYLPLLPENLRTRFRLECLRRKAALEAIEGPLSVSGDLNGILGEGFAEKLVGRLLMNRIQKDKGVEEIPGEFVEPVQLQIVCQRFWRDRLQSNRDEILEVVPEVDDALSRYYEDSLSAAMDVAGVPEERLRTWFGEKLITKLGTRGIVPREPEQTGGIPDPAIDLLSQKWHIIRGEWRAGARWYELAHDRFIEPIQKSNEEWFRLWRATHRNPLTDGANEWRRLNFDEGCLFSGAQLADASAWAQKNPEEVSEFERSFLDASIALREKQAQEKEAQRRRESKVLIALADEQRAHARSLRRLAVGLAVALLIALAATIAALVERQNAIGKRQDADNARATAVAAQTESEAQRFIVTSRMIARQATSSLERDPQLSLLLGIEAFTTKYTIEASHALRAAWEASRSRILSGHTGNVNALAFSPTVGLVATASDDGTARVWDVATGQQEHSFSAGGRVIATAFSPDGNLLATGSGNGSTQIWGMTDEKERLPFETGKDIVAVVFSPDGKWLVSGSLDGMAQVWDVAGSKKGVQLKGHQAGIKGAAVSPDSELVATASLDGTAILWDIHTGERKTDLIGHTKGVNTVAFSPDGQFLATAGADGTARLWEIATGRLVAVLEHRGGVTAVAFSPDGSKVATASLDHTAGLWEVTSGKALYVLSGHSDQVNAVTFSPDGQRLATASSDGTARLWDPSNGKLMEILHGHTSSVNAVLYEPEGNVLVTASSDQTARLWDVAGNEAEPVLPVYQSDVFGSGYFNLSPDGTRLVTIGEQGKILLWDIQAVLDSGSRAEPTIIGNPVESKRIPYLAALSPDGKYLIEVTYSRAEGDPTGPIQTSTINLWDITSLDNPEMIASQDINGRVVPGLAFSPDGRLLASSDLNVNPSSGSAFTDAKVHIWDISNDKGQIKEVGQLPVTQDKFVQGLSFGNLDGSLFLAAAEVDKNYKTGLIRLWDVSTILSKGAPSAPAASLVEDVAQTFLTFNPKGTLLASGGSDGAVRLWTTAQVVESGGNGAAPVILHGHGGGPGGGMLGLAFSPDGSLLASAGGRNGTVRLWDVAQALKTGSSSATIAIFEEYASSPWSGFVSRGTRLVTSSLEGARLWIVGPAEMAANACSRATRNLTWEEWGNIGSNLPYHLTCKQLPVPPSVHEAVIKSSLDYIRQNNLDEALAVLRRAQEFDPFLAPEKDVAQLLVEQGRELARQGNLDKAMISMSNALELDPSLDIKPEIEVLVERGRELARQGEVDAGLVFFEKAIEKSPSLEIKQEAARLLVDRGRELARQGITNEAQIDLTRAVELDPTLGIRPESEVLVEYGRELARQGDVEAAVASLQKAVDLDPTLKIIPEAEAGRIAASALVEKGTSLALQGQIEEAMATLADAQKYDPTVEISANDWNALCWHGSLYGHAKDVLQYCELAVTLAPEDGGIRDSRGLARALTGDFEGAIQDFEFFVEWSKEPGSNAQNVDWREKWISELKAGRNPFTEETLQALLNE